MQACISYIGVIRLLPDLAIHLLSDQMIPMDSGHCESSTSDQQGCEDQGVCKAFCLTARAR